MTSGSQRLGPRLAAELVGTFALVFAGTSAIAVHELTGVVTHVGVALTFGLAVMTMIYAVGDVSGAHFNPAVSFGLWMARRLPGGDLISYVASQVAGAVAASLGVKLLFPASGTLGVTLPSGPWAPAFGVEVVATFFLVFVILRVATGAREKGITAGVAIGGAVAMGALFAGPFSGGSMNPARSLGPALVGLSFDSLWIYMTAPLVGSAVAVAVDRAIGPGGA